VDQFSDENVAWPSYVDFLSTFVFILILFVGCLVFFISDVQQRADRQKRLQNISKQLNEEGIANVVDGERIILSLRGEVQFERNSSELDTMGKDYLKKAGYRIAKLPPAERIVVQGFADTDKCKNDEFCNWQYSVNRAIEVLKFLYKCDDCGYGPEIKRKLVLAGNGDLSAAKIATSADRRVDVVLDYSPPQ
jgi:flagellar motor protein MotB